MLLLLPLRLRHSCTESRLPSWFAVTATHGHISVRPRGRSRQGRAGFAGREFRVTCSASDCASSIARGGSRSLPSALAVAVRLE